MISIVVPVWRKDVYAKTCKPWIDKQVEKYGAQLIEVSGYDSIFESLEAGRKQAIHDVIVYVHDDVALVYPDDLSLELVKAFKERPKLGLIGAVGKGEEPKSIPWWQNDGNKYGHYMYRVNGQVVYNLMRNGVSEKHEQPSKGNVWDKWQKTALVDGFFLAEHRKRVNVPWDCETFPNAWHGYDMDRCIQTKELGYYVAVTPWLFLHDEAGHKTYKGGEQAWRGQLDVVNGLLRDKYSWLS